MLEHTKCWLLVGTRYIYSLPVLYSTTGSTEHLQGDTKILFDTWHFDAMVHDSNLWKMFFDSSALPSIKREIEAGMHAAGRHRTYRWIEETTVDKITATNYIL